jgi:hypothetical protein
MNDQFIPLVPRGAKMTAQPESAKLPFQSLHSPAAPASTHAAAQTAAHPAGIAPEVTLKRDGDRVTHISVRCSCGEVLELACVY